MSASTCQHQRHFEFMDAMFSEFNEVRIENIQLRILLFQEFYHIKPLQQVYMFKWNCKRHLYDAIFSFAKYLVKLFQIKLV